MSRDDISERGAFVKHVVPREREAETLPRAVFEEEVRHHPRAVVELARVRGHAALAVGTQEVTREELRRGEDDALRAEADGTAPVVTDRDDIDAAASPIIDRDNVRRRESETLAEPSWLREIEAPVRLAELEAGAPTAMLPARQPDAGLHKLDQLMEREPERVAAQVKQWMAAD